MVLPAKNNLFTMAKWFLSFFSTVGVLCIINPAGSTSIAVFIFLFAGFLSLYHYHDISHAILTRNTKEQPSAKKESLWIALIFTVFLILSNNWLDFLLSHSLLLIAKFIISSFGIFFAILTATDWAYCYLENRTILEARSVKPRHIKRVFAGSFFSLWIVYFIFFLNQYPGSLSVDTHVQLAQAMGDMHFENANPLINTLLLTVCVKFGLHIRETVNAGIAVYTLFQFTLTALIFAYSVTVIYKHNFSKYIVLLAQCFYNFLPHNIIYATGMWKDTFFAVLFLAALTILFDFIMMLLAGSNITKKACFAFGIVVFLASLARNSGWSSLLVLSVFLLYFSIRNKEKIMAILSCSMLVSILAAIVTMSFIYPAFGVVNNGDITVGLSVPLQQVARVVAYDGEISESEKQQINTLIDMDMIPEIYDEELSDLMKVNVDSTVLEDNLKEYAILWLKLGLKNPKIYLDAYIRLTQNYWAIDSASWTWDCRVNDNPYGVVRIPKLLPGLNLEDTFHQILDMTHTRFLLHSSLILWFAIFLTGLSCVRKDKLGIILLTPILALYVGLMFTSPASLFRYTYGAYVCAPLLLCFAFITPSHKKT